MIRPDTPPGTDVVCIDASPGKYGDGGLQRGAIYTVEAIHEGLDLDHVVQLVEIDAWVSFRPPYGRIRIGFALSRFRYLDLPASLTSLLTQREIEKARELETTE